MIIQPKLLLLLLICACLNSDCKPTKSNAENKEEKQSLENEATKRPMNVGLEKQEQEHHFEANKTTNQEEEVTEKPMNITRVRVQDKNFEDAKSTSKEGNLKTGEEDEKRSLKEKEKGQEQHHEGTKTTIKEGNLNIEKSSTAVPNFTSEERTKHPEAISTYTDKATTNNNKNKTEPSTLSTVFLKQTEENKIESTLATFIKTEATSAKKKMDEDKSPTPAIALQENKIPPTRNSILRNNHNSRHRHESLNSSDEDDEDYPKSFEHVSLEVQDLERKIVEAGAFPEPKSGGVGLMIKVLISCVLACIALFIN